MSSNAEFRVEGERLIVEVSGTFDPDEAVQRLEWITVACRSRQLTQVLVDCRELGGGVNFFDPLDFELLLAIVRGEFNIRGFQVRDLRRLLPHLTSSQISRMVKRLRMHRLIKKVRGTYHYYLTRPGRRVISAALQLRETCIIPALATEPA